MTAEHRLHAQLLNELARARQRVAALEAAVADTGAIEGLGVTPEGVRNSGRRSYYDSLGLVEPGQDISEYLGSEDNPDTRPALGPDAPEEVRPKKAPPVSARVGQVVRTHPDDDVIFNFFASSEEKPVPAGSLPHLAGGSAAAGSSGKKRPAEEAETPFEARSERSGIRSQVTLNAEMASRAFLALQGLDIGVWDWNLAQGTLYASSRWQSIMGREPGSDEQPAAGVAACLHPADAQLFMAELQRLLQGETSQMSLTVRIRRAENRWAWGRLRALCRQDARHMPVRVVATVMDITAQREAESALRASEEKFRALAEESPDLICRFDTKGRFIYASADIRRYLPVGPEELQGRMPSEVIEGGETAFFEENLFRVLEMGLPIHTEILLDFPLAGAFVADCRFWPEFDTQGDISSVTVQIRDMTLSRRMAENYYALFNRMVDGFVLFEHIPYTVDMHAAVPAPEARDFVLLAMNGAFSRIMHLEENMGVGHRLNEVMGRDAPVWAEHLAAVLQTGNPVQVALRGRERPAFYELSAYSPETGQIACIVKDVTEMRLIEQEVRLNEARFAALYRMSHMDDAPEEEVVQFSLDQAVQLTGSAMGYLYLLHEDSEGTRETRYWSREVLARRSLLGSGPAVSEAPDLNEAFFAAIQRARIYNGQDAAAGRIFGSDLAVQRFMLAPVIEEDRVVCVAAVANKQQEYESSDLRQLEIFLNGMWYQLRRRWAVQALRQAKESAEAASRAKNEFLANVSHELRTPLNGILGMLQLLQQSYLTREQTEWVSTAYNSGRSLLRIISDILDFSRIEAGRLELDRHMFDFAATVRSTLGMFVHQAERKNLAFDLQMDSRIPAVLVGDDARLRQIIFNLVGNAFKFTESGSITVTCHLLPRSREGTRAVYLAIADTGIGIPDEKLDHIFRAFTQLDGSHTRRYAGTGLGLGIVQRLIQLMGGALCVESMPGKGTVMHCSLFFSTAPLALRPAGQAGAALPPARPLDILVAEDDPVNQLAIRTMLKKAGHSAVCVDNGREALEALLLKPFDCLITDIQMPGMDGLELTRRIREGRVADIDPSEKVRNILGVLATDTRVYAVPADIPVVALTAHAMSGDKERFIVLGMDYYLSKPIIGEELRDVLSRISYVRLRQ